MIVLFFCLPRSLYKMSWNYFNKLSTYQTKFSPPPTLVSIMIHIYLREFIIFLSTFHRRQLFFFQNTYSRSVFHFSPILGLNLIIYFCNVEIVTYYNNNITTKHHFHTYIYIIHAYLIFVNCFSYYLMYMI